MGDGVPGVFASLDPRLISVTPIGVTDSTRRRVVGEPGLVHWTGPQSAWEDGGSGVLPVGMIGGAGAPGSEIEDATETGRAQSNIRETAS
jgi:hypothetical protein